MGRDYKQILKKFKTSEMIGGMALRHPQKPMCLVVSKRQLKSLITFCLSS